MKTFVLLFSVCSTCSGFWLGFFLFVYFFSQKLVAEDQIHPCIALSGHSYIADGTVISGGQKHNILKNTLVIFLLGLTAYEFLLNDFQIQN